MGRVQLDSDLKLLVFGVPIFEFGPLGSENFRLGSKPANLMGLESLMSLNLIIYAYIFLYFKIGL